MKTLKTITLFAVLGCAPLLMPSAHAAEKPKDEAAKYISKTFADIQSRATREPESGAIIAVKAREDGPTKDASLNFSITKSSNEAVIILSAQGQSMVLGGHTIYEQYRLRLDDAMRAELVKQEKLQELNARREARALEERKKQITEISGGKLAHGMTLEEVVVVKGKPTKTNQWQAAGGFTAIYPDMSLDFWNMRLNEIRKITQVEVKSD